MYKKNLYENSLKNGGYFQNYFYFLELKSFLTDFQHLTEGKKIT